MATRRRILTLATALTIQLNGIALADFNGDAKVDLHTPCFS